MSDKKTHSVIALYESMVSALKANDNNDFSWLLPKCSSQGTIASTRRKSLGIFPMTLNTFKKYAEIYIDGGFKQLDEIRKQLKLFPNKSHQKTQKKSNVSISDYKNQLVEAERMRALLLRAYNDLNNITLDAIVSSPQFKYDYERHNEIYSKYFSLNIVINDE